MHQKLEDKFNVIHPTNKNATYSSIMNYSDDLKKPLQRWYRYKEGFSIELVKQLIEDYNKNPNGVILDPFLGSGTTVITANKLGFKGIGFEVNPFSYFLSKCKLRNYEEDCIKEFHESFNEITKKALERVDKYPLPKLSISKKVFDDEVEDFFMTVKQFIEKAEYKFVETKELMLLGWLSSIEELSNYRKAGNGLKKKKYVKPRILSKEDGFSVISNAYQNIYEDIINNHFDFDIEIYNDSSLNMESYISDSSISGIIFSPPYANCFDYTEIYKLELWFGEFVNKYSDLKKLREVSLRSHLNGNLVIPEDAVVTDTLELLLKELETKELWDKRIPKMLKLYFNDMFRIIDNAYKVLENDGFCSIVVGNSAYGGIVFPTDLILAEYAESIGFTVDKVEVDRYIITSSQQYEMTKNNKKFLRESVVCLIKK